MLIDKYEWNRNICGRSRQLILCSEVVLDKGETRAICVNNNLLSGCFGSLVGPIHCDKRFGIILCCFES